MIGNYAHRIVLVYLLISETLRAQRPIRINGRLHFRLGRVVRAGAYIGIVGFLNRCQVVDLSCSLRSIETALVLSVTTDISFRVLERSHRHRLVLRRRNCVRRDRGYRLGSIEWKLRRWILSESLLVLHFNS